MNSMKVMIYGEGPTDYGWKNKSGKWEEGPAVRLVRKCAFVHDVDLDIEFGDKAVIDGKKRIKLGTRHLRGVRGKGIPALHFALYAMRNKCDKGIFYCDTDRVIEGKNTKEDDCRKHFLKIYDEVIFGFQAADVKDWKGIPMIALKMIECWLLSDEDAYKECFGQPLFQCRLPRKPELIWGEKSDKESNYPKNYMERVLKQYYKESGKECFLEIADAMQVDVLRNKCPISFGKFFEDFEKMCILSK